MGALQGIATVAAVDCDDQSNQPLCGEYNVQGFPTLKVRAQLLVSSSCLHVARACMKRSAASLIVRHTSKQEWLV